MAKSAHGGCHIPIKTKHEKTSFTTCKAPIVLPWLLVNLHSNIQNLLLQG